MTLSPLQQRGPAPEPISPAEELACLQRKLSKRQNAPGFAANAEEISARIAELEAELSGV